MELPLAVKEPLSTTPPRVPGSVRRSSHIDVVWQERGRLRLDAAARDVTTPGGVVAEASLAAEIAPGRVAWIETTPAAATEELVGLSPMAGFRRAAVRAIAGRVDEPLGLLLDDLPMAVMLSGYGRLREGAISGPIAAAGDPAGPMRDLCSGWRSGGTMIASLERGEGVPVPELAPAPALGRDDDPLAVEALAGLPVGSLRRRRRIDVAPGDPVAVEATFRDSFWAAEGEGVLHEYVVRATCDAAGRVRTIEAEPRVLPWVECPAAAGHVAGLVGAEARDLGRTVRDTLTGVSSCTHLNDLLRSLACLPRLIALRPPG
ncbi:MAG TPA: DUF2889 domain-containing protein [Acidimicrobiales bacterium]